MSNIDVKSFGVRFKELRESINLTQTELGKILDIPRYTIKDWEVERRVPPVYVQRLLLKELCRIQKKLKKL